MRDYSNDLHTCIRDLFAENEVRIEVRMIANDIDVHDHNVPTGIRVAHLPTGLEVVCEDYATQIQNANIALLRLKKLIG